MASAKAENRDSYGSKRSRSDVSRNDGDWTCHKCGNLNFSFRTVCNRSECAAERPSPSPSTGAVPLPGAFDHPLYYGGSAQMPLSVPGVGYRVPLFHPGMRYDYGVAPTSPGPYGFHPGFGPLGPIGGVDYSRGPGIERYGYGYSGSPLPVPGSWSEADLPDANGSRKRRGGPDGLSEGDWICPKCDNVNFAFRTICNMKKCATPRPTAGPIPPSSGNKVSSGVPEGSWTCNQCGNLNYPFRTVCNRKGCGSEKP